MLSAGGHVPTHTLAPASASALAIANPNPRVVGHAGDEGALAREIDVEHGRNRSLAGDQLPAPPARVRHSITNCTRDPDRRDAPTRPVSSAVGRAVATCLLAPGPSFARGLWRIAAADVSSGNASRCLRDGPATFAAMLDAIDGADERRRARELHLPLRRGRRTVRRRADRAPRRAA